SALPAPGRGCSTSWPAASVPAPLTWPSSWTRCGACFLRSQSPLDPAPGGCRCRRPPAFWCPGPSTSFSCELGIVPMSEHCALLMSADPRLARAAREAAGSVPGLRLETTHDGAAASPAAARDGIALVLLHLRPGDDEPALER